MILFYLHHYPNIQDKLLRCRFPFFKVYVAHCKCTTMAITFTKWSLSKLHPGGPYGVTHRENMPHVKLHKNAIKSKKNALTWKKFNSCINVNIHRDKSKEQAAEWSWADLTSSACKDIFSMCILCRIRLNLDVLLWLWQESDYFFEPPLSEILQYKWLIPATI